MSAMAPNEYKQASLPKLSTWKELCRRDSLSSSRTRDSGYNSDLDSLSPLEVVGLNQELMFTPLPPMPDIFINSKPALWKRRCDIDRPVQARQADVTSNYTSGGDASDLKLPSIILSHIPESNTFQRCSPGDSLEIGRASNDEDIEKWVVDHLPSRPNERVSSIVSLLSTSSGDMYTNTDISDDEQEHGDRAMRTRHSRSTVKTIDMIMHKIELSLRHASFTQCTGSSAPNARSGATLASQQDSRRTSQSSGHKRKSRRDESPPPDGDDEDGSNKRRRGSAVTTDDSETGARFACPFYKHDPDRYRHRRTCHGPGWPTVHRVKEHLYRSHSQPIYCPICYATFKSDKEQSNHVRLQQCQRVAPQQIEGIDRETVWALRKRTTALRLEEDKWRDVYQVLFPDVLAADIPSPFYDCDSPSESSRRFRRELLRRVQNELYATAEQLTGSIEQQLLQRVAHIIRDCEEDLLKTPEVSSAEQDISVPILVQTPGQASPSPFLRPTTSYDNRELTNFPTVAVPTTQREYVPEPRIGFAPVVWGEQMYDPFISGIDWDVPFPPAPELYHPEEQQPVTALSAAMRT